MTRPKLVINERAFLSGKPKEGPGRLFVCDSDDDEHLQAACSC